MLTFAPLTILPNGREVKATGREAFRILYPTRTVNGSVIKGDLAYDLSVNDLVEGSVERFTTAIPYEVEAGKFVSHITVAAFSTENAAQLAADKAGVAVLDDAGKVSAEPKKKTSAPAGVTE